MSATGFSVGTAGLTLLTGWTFALANPASIHPIEEVIVLARKLPESRFELPLAVDVVKTRDVAAFGDLAAIAQRVPGVYFESAWGGLFSSPTIRGQAQPTGRGDNVGVFVDGIHQANRVMVDVEPLDVDRVEVARGPQNALFGHSTFAGAIHYVSREPGERFESAASLEAGSDRYRAAQAFASGPLPGGHLRGRIALGARRFDGTGQNAEPGGGPLGGYQRRSARLALTRPDSSAWSFGVDLRLQHDEWLHPVVTPVDPTAYNCGAVERQAGAWSYYCGRLPVPFHAHISAGLRSSDNKLMQGALSFSLPLRSGVLRASTAGYRGDSETYRDFDSSGIGELFGTCSVSRNCRGGGHERPTVNRLVYVNEVQRQTRRVQEFSQEVRWYTEPSTMLRWMIGATAIATRDDGAAAIGATSAHVQPDEILTALLPATPEIAGPPSIFNGALVVDATREQRLLSRARTKQHVVAAFGSIDLRLHDALSLGGELRWTREKQEVRNPIANFAPGFGDALAPVTFESVTPRVSVVIRPAPTVNLYLSAARGSRAGGINPVPGLMRHEQTYAPEYNWTYELGLRARAFADQLTAELTAFHIDWKDTQIVGFATTPGVGNLIVTNTAGVETDGVEARFHYTPATWIGLSLAYAYIDARYSRGSDDPGSSRFCGLRPGNDRTSFCTVGPVRTGDAPFLVPYVDGNPLQRSPRNSWSTTLELEQPTASGATLGGWLTLSGQDDVFERAIGGARYGRRTLVDAAVQWSGRAFSLSLWGRNLTNERYARSVGLRGAVFDPTVPRRLDVIQGTGRQLGITASLSIGRRNA